MVEAILSSCGSSQWGESNAKGIILIPLSFFLKLLGESFLKLLAVLIKVFSYLASSLHFCPSRRGRRSLAEEGYLRSSYSFSSMNLSKTRPKDSFIPLTRFEYGFLSQEDGPLFLPSFSDGVDP